MKIETPKEYKHNQRDLLADAPMCRGTFDFDAFKKDAENRGPFKLKINGEVLNVVYNTVLESVRADAEITYGLTFTHYKNKRRLQNHSSDVSNWTNCNTPISDEKPISAVFKDGTELDLAKYNDEYKYYKFNTDILKVGTLIQFHYVSDFIDISSIGIVTGTYKESLTISYITDDGMLRQLNLHPHDLYYDEDTFEWDEIEYEWKISHKETKTRGVNKHIFHTEELEDYPVDSSSDDDDDEEDTSDWVDVDENES